MADLPWEVATESAVAILQYVVLLSSGRTTGRKLKPLEAGILQSKTPAVTEEAAKQAGGLETIDTWRRNAESA